MKIFNKENRNHPLIYLVTAVICFGVAVFFVLKDQSRFAPFWVFPGIKNSIQTAYYTAKRKKEKEKSNQ